MAPEPIVVPPAIGAGAQSIVSSAAARRALAAAWLGGVPADARLGEIILLPHQRAAIPRLHRALRELGGALLADPPGLGKTYVALAVAREYTTSTVVAPASLRSMWQRAAARARIRIRFLSYESLSRSTHSFVLDPPPDLLVLDEAHHARNRATRRHARLREIAADARVLLLSATPIHNAPRDLESVLALFLGEHAERVARNDLARLVVRREVDVLDAHASIPETPPPIRVRVPASPRVLDALLALPPAIPPRDGGRADALATASLVRAWASSTAALRGALQRRLATALALDSALDSGRLPTRDELRRWRATADVIQLAMPLFALEPSREADDVAALRQSLRAHTDALRAARSLLDSSNEDAADTVRADRLRMIRDRHAGESILAFSHSADTVRALYRLLAPSGAVAMLTAQGGRIASGPVTRNELLARFAPRAAGLPPPRTIERIELLVTTDLLAEGVNLQDASVVVHLDLPWTPAALTQRVGRAARLGASHSRVTTYLLAPPAPAARLLAVERRLVAKAGHTAALGGAAARELLGAHHETSTRDAEQVPAPHSALQLLRRLERWSASPAADDDGSRGCLIAAVTSARSGFIAAIRRADGTTSLLASLDEREDDVRAAAPSDALDHVAAVARFAEGPDACVDSGALGAALASIERWRRDGQLRDALGVRASPSPPVDEPFTRQLLARADRALHGAPAHRRVALAVAADRVRRALVTPLSAGLEDALRNLLRSPAAATGGDWLLAASDLLSGRVTAALSASTRGSELPASAPPVIALLLLQRA